MRRCWCHSYGEWCSVAVRRIINSRSRRSVVSWPRSAHAKLIHARSSSGACASALYRLTCFAPSCSMFFSMSGGSGASGMAVTLLLRGRGLAGGAVAPGPVGNRRSGDLPGGGGGGEPAAAGLQPQVARVSRADEAGQRLGRGRGHDCVLLAEDVEERAPDVLQARGPAGERQLAAQQPVLADQEVHRLAEGGARERH